jgi:type IV pilus assembly protein PilW
MYYHGMLNIKHNKTGFSRDSGFTLIELMLAMLIGLIIMGGVMKLYITTRDTQRTSEDQMQLISDARFVMQTIAFDLRHAGIWGGTNETKLIACKKNSDLTCPVDVSTTDLALVTDDCAATNDWYIDLDFPVIAFDANNPYSGTCAKQGYQLDTDVLGLHYADTITVPSGTGPGNLASGVVYVRSNIRNGMLFVGDTYIASSSLYKWIDNPLDSVTRNYPLRSMVYYVSDYTDVVGDSLPSLHRVELKSGPTMVDSVLIPGVEDFQLEFGLDTTGDFQVNTYVNASNVTNTNWQGGDVVAVKIWLLMRAENADRDGVGGNQTFTLAGKPSVTYTDSVRRFLMTGVVRLRNTSRVDQLKAGG